MLATSALLPFLAICGLSAAAPQRASVNLSKKASGFELHQSEPRALGPPVVRVAATYGGRNEPMPEHIDSAVKRAQLAKRTSSTLDMKQDSYMEYDIPVTIGNQVFSIVFDSVGADFWVFYQGGPSYIKKYVPSSTSVSKSGSFDVTYFDGNRVKGVLFADTVQVGPVTVTSQGIQAATAVSSGLTYDANAQGRFGFAFPSANTASPYKQKNIFENLLPQLDQPVFTADMKFSGPGTFGLGFIDTARYNSSTNITYTGSADKYGSWTSAFSGYQVASAAVKSSSVTVIISTIDAYILLPDATVRDYYSKVPGAQVSDTYGGYVFACSRVPNLPSFGLVVNGITFTIPGKYMTLGDVNGGGSTTTGSTCYGALQSSNYFHSQPVVGTTFLKAVFVVFDRGQTRIGYAAKPL